ncbi:MAG: hypothetical protein RBG13Loki_3588 [Promethearchaeota archaeon CR_4]|nr:MAG: hypothetical protein RBG13Loki_3588 [Candidatus Lokiarchaeota archaeon CR_4]
MKKSVLVLSLVVVSSLMAALAVSQTTVVAESETTVPPSFESDFLPEGPVIMEENVIETAHQPLSGLLETITRPGAAWIQVHFKQMQIGDGFDFVYVEDSADNELRRYTGLKDNFWSPINHDDTIKIRYEPSGRFNYMYGFKIDAVRYSYYALQVEPEEAGLILETPVKRELGHGSGVIEEAGKCQMWTIHVKKNAWYMQTVLTPANGDAELDIYGKFGAEPNPDAPDPNWNVIHLESGKELVSLEDPAEGTWYIMVYSSSGSAAYDLSVRLIYSSTLDKGLPSTGYIDYASSTRMDYWFIQVPEGMTSMRATVTALDGWSDFNIYGRLGNYPVDSEIGTICDWYGVDRWDEDVVINNPDAGTWYIRVDANRGGGSYKITVGVTDNPDADGIVTKWAVIVGMVTYQSKDVEDSLYLDKAANNWYNYLTDVVNYDPDNIRVLGDEVGLGELSRSPIWGPFARALMAMNYPWTSRYPYEAYYGRATEANAKRCLQWMVDGADADDQIAVIWEGHGDGDLKGSSYFKCWDFAGKNKEEGKLTDHEFAGYISKTVAEHIFIFTDACRSGGFIDEIAGLQNKARVYITTTCTYHGFGHWYDGLQDAAWNHYFLVDGLTRHFASTTKTLMEDCFVYAYPRYTLNKIEDSGWPPSPSIPSQQLLPPEDFPQQFDGDPYVGFTL